MVVGMGEMDAIRDVRSVPLSATWRTGLSGTTGEMAWREAERLMHN